MITSPNGRAVVSVTYAILTSYRIVHVYTIVNKLHSLIVHCLLHERGRPFSITKIKEGLLIAPALSRASERFPINFWEILNF